MTRTDGKEVKFEVVERDDERWLRFAGDAVPADLPAVGKDMAFQVPVWKIAPFEQKLSDFVATESGS
ncbi:MAG: hypothetical protein HWD60_16960 [Defluviicoccus sp.]|nr:MAG: hypothetical protein HWD60_16960 [Defluviicoccus sp.]